MVKRRRKDETGRRLVALREAKGLSAAELCAASGLTSSEVSLWEAGKRAVPRTDRVLSALARAFDVPPATMMNYVAGAAEVSAVVPQSDLDQALTLDRRWSQAAIEVARELEARAAKQSKLSLNVADWVRQLDAIEKQIDATVKSRWERLMSDEDILGEDEPAKGTRKRR